MKYGKHKFCFNPDSLIILVQNSIPAILFENLILLYWLTVQLINIFYITDMLPEHKVSIRVLISECFCFKCDFSKGHCSSLKMILGSKHVGAILNVLS